MSISARRLSAIRVNLLRTKNTIFKRHIAALLHARRKWANEPECITRKKIGNLRVQRTKWRFFGRLVAAELRTILCDYAILTLKNLNNAVVLAIAILESVIVSSFHAPSNSLNAARIVAGERHKYERAEESIERRRPYTKETKTAAGCYIYSMPAPMWISRQGQ